MIAGFAKYETETTGSVAVGPRGPLWALVRAQRLILSLGLLRHFGTPPPPALLVLRPASLRPPPPVLSISFSPSCLFRLFLL